jgi:tricorn protease
MTPGSEGTGPLGREGNRGPGPGYRLAQLAAVGSILGGAFDLSIRGLMPHHEAFLGVPAGGAPEATGALVVLVLNTLGVALVAVGGMALALLVVWRRHDIAWAAWAAAAGIALAQGMNAWAISRFDTPFIVGPLLFPFLALGGVWWGVRRRSPGVRPVALAGAVLLIPALALAALATWTPGLAAQGVPSLAEPGISPDGREIAFASGGDIWTVSSEGGAARLLVAHSAHESRPLYSPDGTRLAFNSNRNGGEDVFLMDLATGEVTRLTHDSGSEQLAGWSRDGEWVYFTSGAQDISGRHDVFRVRADGGTPMVVAGDRFESEFFAAPAPEPGLLAISTRGNMARGQWWRNGHSHIDEAEIWTVREAAASGEAPIYTRVSVGGKNLWPLWGGDGATLYFMSDRSGSENLWRAGVDGSGEEQLTNFPRGRLLWPSITADGSIIAFERDFGIWRYDVATGTARRLDIRLLGAVEGPTAEVSEESRGWSDIVVSPDGEKWAFTRGGEVFATTLEGDVPATRVTRTPAAEGGVVWSPDSRQVVYTSWRSGTPKIHAHDFVTDQERELTRGEGRDQVGSFSPDGRWLAWFRVVDEESELHIMEWATGEDRRLAIDVVGTSMAWSPDSRWIAYGAETDEFTNVMVVPVTGGDPRQVSFVANSNFGSLQWSAKGDYLVYRSGQRTEPNRLVKVDMIPLPPTFDEDRFRELFNRPEEEPTPGSPGEAREGAGGAAGGGGAVEVPEEIEIDFEGIRRRGGFVEIPFSMGSVLLSPDGETGIVAGDSLLHRITFGPNGDVELERLDVRGTPLGFNADGNRLYVTLNGELRVVTLPGGATRTVSTTVRLEDDFEATKVAAFEQGWGEMRDGFYDVGYHGVDWEGVRDTFRPQIEGARTRAEFNRLMNLMLGELNASHLGHSGRTGPPQEGDGASTGRLGLRFDRIAYEDDGRFLVEEVVDLGPADISDAIQPGDRVLAVDGVQLDGTSDLDRLLRDTPGKKVMLRVQRGGGEPRDVELLATSTGAEGQLIYRNWVESRRAYVDSISGGRLGYVHIASMSEGALDQLIFDLDQLNHTKEGVVVDVRHNNGGFVNVYAIDILARRNYFTMQGRASDVEAPSRVRLGQRALLAPTVLVTNQHTLSDGEDFTEGYRTLGLGSVVGEPTAGWIIFTGSRTLVDGTAVRMPGTRIRDLQGREMELVPRPVDVEVERPAGEEYLGRDSQLDRAVETLLGELAGAGR